MKIPLYLSTVKFEDLLMIFREVYILFMTILPLAQFQHGISVDDDGDFGGWISRKWDCFFGEGVI